MMRYIGIWLRDIGWGVIPVWVEGGTQYADSIWRGQFIFLGAQAPAVVAAAEVDRLRVVKGCDEGGASNLLYTYNGEGKLGVDVGKLYYV